MRPRSEVILLDRDGVLNVDLPGAVRSRDQFVLIPGAAEAVALLNRSGYLVVVISNQACIGRGELSERELTAIHEKLKAEVAAVGGCLEAIYVCPHTDADTCSCRKPKPGLLLAAQRDYAFVPEATWFVGDDQRDLQAALAVGVRPALVRTGKGAQVAPSTGVPVFNDLMDFAQTVARNTA